MPKSINIQQQQEPNSQSKGYHLRSAAKLFPHESRSVVFLGVSRRRSDIKEARNRIGQRRVILLAVSKKQVDLSPKSIRLVQKRMLHLTASTVSSSGKGEKSVEPNPIISKNDSSKGPPLAIEGCVNEEVQCLFFNCSDEFDATPRSDSNSSDGCCWTTPMNSDFDDEHVSGSVPAILPPVPAPSPTILHSYSGPPSVFGQLIAKRVRSECGDSYPGSGIVKDAFFNEFLHDIRQSRI